ncbi:hypothetical protein B9479_004868 [Cryptococcus floricola]|uniref:F-box domain-containing protein n=1 Tax=Cryptococcus floricola TaxID=2591691 RepID=A0A5D3AUE7_9TREE|nr:hypothetical protein B9479_004868 [Cryptococcus floricola]
MSSQPSRPDTPSTSSTPDITDDFSRLDLHTPREQSSSSASSAIAAGKDKADEDEELERFRAQWRQELLAKKSEGGVNGETGESLPKKENREVEDVEVDGKGKGKQVSPKATKAPQLPTFQDEDDEAPTMGPLAHTVAPTINRAHVPKKTLTHKERAIQTYAKAVESEQSGQLNEALIHYRRAFKMDDEVDKLYTKSMAKASADQLAEKAAISEDLMSEIPNSSDIISPSAPAEEPYSFQRHIQLDADYDKSSALPSIATSTAHKSPLSTILGSLPINPWEFAFLPENDKLPIPIANLPAELIDPILAHLDVIWIERFASTCWRARYLTSGSMAWRRVCERIYRPPAMVPPGGVVKTQDLVKKHGGEWRTTLIEEERVRMDGCYIAVCHYIRPGAGEEWVTITHLITYHRYLRFYPDGSVISYLTTDHPSDVVPVLKPSLRGKGLHFGRWRLLRSDASLDPENDPIWVPSEPHERKPARILVSGLLEPGIKEAKYEFEMELALRETSRGRWNKLDLLEYRSVNLGTDETLGLGLRNQKPFYFSKVRSYNPPF